MSAFLPLLGKVTTGATALSGAFSAVKGLFGGGNGPQGPRLDPVTGIDMANKLSAECGFPITQATANYAKAASGGDRRLACELARPAGMNVQPHPLPGPAQPGVISGGAMVPPSVLSTQARPAAPSPTPLLGAGGNGAFSGGPRMSAQVAGGGAGGMVVSGGLFLWRTATGLIRGLGDATGKIVHSRKSIVKAAKEMGIGAAAAALGIGAVEVAEMVLQESKKPRRRRGITARDLANARRVNCKVARYARDLGIKPAPVRRKTCR